MTRMHPDHEIFIEAIENRRKVVVVSREEDGSRLVRICAPLDWGVRGSDGDREVRYSVWDYENRDADGSRFFSFRAEEIYTISPTGQSFEPAEIVPLDTIWNHSRSWGEFS